MNEKINSINKDDLQEAFNSLYKVKEAELLAEQEKKAKELFLKEDLAQKKHYYKKDRVTPDPGKIKSGIIRKAIEVYINKGPNKIEEELELLEEYILDFQEDNQILSRATKLNNAIQLEKSTKEDIKDTKKYLKTILDIEIVEAIDILTTLEIKAKKLLLEGKENKKNQKNMDEIIQLVKQIKEKLNLSSSVLIKN